MAKQRGTTKSNSNKKSGGDTFWWLALLLLIGGVTAWISWSSKEAKKITPAPAVILEPSTNSVGTNAILPNKPSLLLSNPATRLIATNKSATNSIISPKSESYPRPSRDILEAQIALSKFAISSGSIDGALGSQTRAALMALQTKVGLPPTGDFDWKTRGQLPLPSPAIIHSILTSNDLARLQPIGKTWLEKSHQSALDFETALELVAERSHASPNLIRRLNPTVNWSNVVAGTEVSVPNAQYPKAKIKAASIVISLSKKQLEVFDSETNLLAHFPCSIAARFDKRPIGELHVMTVAPNPDYTFNPETFPESEEAQQMSGKLILPPARIILWAPPG